MSKRVPVMLLIVLFGVLPALADQSAHVVVSPADGEEIIARAETIQAGSTIAVVKVEVVSQKAGAERACAFATATMRAMDLPAGFR
jgi:acyl-coenzyme A thioesterase PaaI-like protein